MQKKGWLALCPTNYTFNILYCSFFPHQLVHSLSYIFFSSIFSSTHVQSHSSISTLLSFKFPLIFVILCCLPLSSTFFPVCASSSTYECFISSDFSPLLTQVSHYGFFVLLFFLFFFCKPRLFISFISSSIFFFWLRF